MKFFDDAVFRQQERPPAVEAGVVVRDDRIVLLLRMPEDLAVSGEFLLAVHEIVHVVPDGAAVPSSAPTTKGDVSEFRGYEFCRVFCIKEDNLLSLDYESGQ